MQTLSTLINRFLEKLLIAMMMAIVATVSWQVFSRFILHSPSSFTEELARYLLIWIGILGAAYAYKTRAHLGLDLILEKAPQHWKKTIQFVIELAVITFASTIMIYGGVSLVSLTIELKQISAALGIQVGIVYSVIPFSGILITIFALENLVDILRTKGEA